MSKIKFVLNKKGVSELLKSQKTKDMLDDYSSKAMERLGEGYEKDVYSGRFRANSSIRAKWSKTKSDNLKHNTIWKAIMGTKK